MRDPIRVGAIITADGTTTGVLTADDVLILDAEPAWRVKCESCDAIADPVTHKIKHRATEPMPNMDLLQEWVMDSVCDATDGCQVEPDGHCEHGHQSWLLRLGLI